MGVDLGSYPRAYCTIELGKINADQARCASCCRWHSHIVDDPKFTPNSRKRFLLPANQLPIGASYVNYKDIPSDVAFVDRCVDIGNTRNFHLLLPKWRREPWRGMRFKQRGFCMLRPIIHLSEQRPLRGRPRSQTVIYL